MFKKFINALKTSKPARFALIAILLLMVVLCVAAAYIGIPISAVIIVMLIIGYPVIITVGGIGAAVGIAGSAISNKKSYDEISSKDPTLADIEKERGKLQMYNIIFWVAAVILCITALLLGQTIGLIIMAIACVLFYFLKLYPMNREFNKSFGDYVVVGEVNRQFSNASYDASKGFDAEEVESVSFTSYDVYTGTDYIEGDLDRLHFRSCELRLESMNTTVDEDNDSHTSYSTLFWGYLYSIPLSKHIGATVFAADKKFRTGLKDKLETGTDEFDKNIKVHSKDPETAGKVLSGPVTREILSLSEASKDPLCIVFHGDKLYAFVKSDESSCFSVNLSKDINMAQLRDGVREHLSEQVAILTGLDKISQALTL